MFKARLFDNELLCAHQIKIFYVIFYLGEFQERLMGDTSTYSLSTSTGELVFYISRQSQHTTYQIKFRYIKLMKVQLGQEAILDPRSQRAGSYKIGAVIVHV